MLVSLITNESAVVLGIVLAVVATGLGLAALWLHRRHRQQEAPIRRGTTRVGDAHTEVR